MQQLVPLYSRNKSEAEIQADLYCEIKRLNLEPRLQVRGYLPEGRKCIFDLVVFWPLNHRPLCIIECKRGISVNGASRQKERYGRFNLPLLYCFRNNAAAIVEQVRQLAAADFKHAPPSMRRAAEWANYIGELDTVE